MAETGSAAAFNDFMYDDKFFYWRLCDELTVVQASLLMIGELPDGDNHYVMQREKTLWPMNFDACMASISSALLSKKVAGRITTEMERVGINGEEQPIANTVDPQLSMVDAASLREYLNGKGFKHGFFGPTLYEKYSPPDYLDPTHKCYAFKLAAAVEAWLAVTAAEAPERGGTPKQAIAKWLRENASKLDLSNKDGNPNNQAIEEIAKIANWNTKGGAAKTPAKPKTAAKGGQVSGNPPTPISSGKTPILKAVGEKQ